jgi:hypothetical protein
MVATKKQPQICGLSSFADARRAFVMPDKRTQSAAHIRRMHWYVACRLVLEGGFDPATIKPHPPMRVERKGKSLLLHHDPSVASGSEATVFGGLKTKDVDVVVSLDGIGPCVAISMKGTLSAFRNLTNRMEEAVGDCTNLHIAYPGLVYAFLHLLRANREGEIPASGAKMKIKPNPKTGLLKQADTALTKTGEVTRYIKAYHDAIARLSGRKDLRDDVTRYEAVGLLLISPDDASLGEVIPFYPRQDSVLHFDNFFQTIYRQYDTRFVYGAPNLRTVTRRHMWHPDSPALALPLAAEMQPRVSEADELDEEVDGDEDGSEQA